MAKGVYAPLYTREREALIKLAMKEDRDPRVQAARFIREGLKAAGALTDPADRPDPTPPAAAAPASAGPA